MSVTWSIPSESAKRTFAFFTVCSLIHEYGAFRIFKVGSSQRIRRGKATSGSVYAALDLHERSVQCVLKDECGRIVRERKMDKSEESRMLISTRIRNVGE